MRVLALLFALYFAVLGCLTCPEAEPCAESGPAAVFQAAPRDCDHGLGCLDWCSPFCQCHCCTGFALPTAPGIAFVAHPVATYPARRFAALPVPVVPARALATPWQPPQWA